MPEREKSKQPEFDPDPPYVKAASYKEERESLHAYSLAQSLILRNNVDLSTYRLLYKEVPHLVVLGLQPPADIDATLEAILGNGTMATLPPDIIRALNQRRNRATRMGPWVEGHYRPGIKLQGGEQM